MWEKKEGMSLVGEEGKVSGGEWQARTWAHGYQPIHALIERDPRPVSPSSPPPYYAEYQWREEEISGSPADA